MVTKKYNQRNSPNVSAQDHPDKTMVGNDKKMYLSKADKNGVFRWVKFKQMDETVDAKTYWSQFGHKSIYNLKDLKFKLLQISKLLKKENILLLETGWKTIGYFVDYSWDEAKNMIMRTHVKSKNKSINILDTFSFLVVSDNMYYWSSVNGKLHIQYNFKNSDDKKYVFKVFKDVFATDVTIPSSSKSTIVVNLQLM